MLIKLYMIYITKDFKNIFFINLKCGYSTFENVLVKNNKILKLNINYDNSKLNETILNKIDPDVKLFLIMRCPFSRICSFYQDKFIDCVKNSNTEQWCHTLMYKHYNREIILQSKFTMSHLINAMKNGYNEGHIFPQSDIIKYNVFKKNITDFRIFNFLR